MYPDAPSTALLRVPLSLGTFFMDLISRKCSQNTPAGPAICFERKTELAAVGCDLICKNDMKRPRKQKLATLNNQMT